MSRFLCITNVRLGADASGCSVRHRAGETVTIVDAEAAARLLAVGAVIAVAEVAAVVIPPAGGVPLAAVAVADAGAAADAAAGAGEQTDVAGSQAGGAPGPSVPPVVDAADTTTVVNAPVKPKAAGKAGSAKPASKAATAKKATAKAASKAS